MEIIKNISIVYISIFFESLPFLFLGAFISSIIETFISNEKLASLIPKNKVLGSLVGVVLGFFLPACDCAVIPISKRLIKKEVPINVAISFMLASPIINPVVILSTYYAFYKTEPNVFWGRLILGIIIALVIGTIMGIIFNNKRVVKNILKEEHHHDHKSNGLKDKLISIFKHTGYDFFDVVKYLLVGALLASTIQILMPRTLLTMFNNNHILSILVLMIFAYLISLCSTSDSFVGKSLLSSFTQSSIVAYLLLGPMIDIKNTIVLLGNYKKGFVAILISLIFIIVFIFTLLGVKLL